MPTRKAAKLKTPENKTPRVIVDNSSHHNTDISVIFNNYNGSNDDHIKAVIIEFVHNLKIDYCNI